jgi:biopolymer transport protein ExbB
METVTAIKDVLLQLGTAWVLWLLGVLSVANVVILVERWLSYRSQATDVPALARQLARWLAKGEFRAAIDALRAMPSVAARITAAGLELAGHGPIAVEHAMASATALERARLEKGLSFLATVGSNAPFVGLLGTVIGVVAAFDELGHGAPGHGTGGAAAEVASQAVMGAIAEALVATAVGLIVALPAVASYNYLQRRVVQLLDGGEVLSRLVLAYLVPALSSSSSSSSAAVAVADGRGDGQH